MDFFHQVNSYFWEYKPRKWNLGRKLLLKVLYFGYFIYFSVKHGVLCVFLCNFARMEIHGLPTLTQSNGQKVQNVSTPRNIEKM